MTVFVSRQLRVTLDTIRNSCDVFLDALAALGEVASIVTLLSWVSSNAFLNGLPDRMQSCTEGICGFFSSVCFWMPPHLDESKQNHTGCIYLICVHCALSNVSLNDLPELMHIHTGCIYFAFLKCVLSNVSWNCLYERTHIYTGCPPLLVVSPLCAFECLLKSPGSEDA